MNRRSRATKILMRNKEWDKMPEEAKQLVYKNLPINYIALVIILGILIFILPIIKIYYFPEARYLDTIRIVVLIFIAIFLIVYTFWNYKRKTGKNLNEEIEKLKLKEYNKQNPDKNKQDVKNTLFIGKIWTFASIIVILSTIIIVAFNFDSFSKSFTTLKSFFATNSFVPIAVFILGIINLFIGLNMIKKAKKVK